MPKSLVILFLGLYLLGLLRPIAPLIEYELNQDYIAEFLCVNKDKPVMACHGKCHLQKELAKAQEEENSHDKPIKIKIEDYPVAWWEISQNLQDLSYQDIEKNSFYSNQYQFLSRDSIFHPPISFC